MNAEDSRSASIRAAAFRWLQVQDESGVDTLPRELLRAGFDFDGTSVQLVGPQGIFKPRQIDYYPLSITTTTKGPYRDSIDPTGKFIRYSYRGTDPNHHENRRLRDAMRDRIPLIYLFSTLPGQYLAIYPVFVVGDDPAQLMFTIAADDLMSLQLDQDDAAPDIRREYVTRAVLTRIHQRSFRDRVLRAYQTRCSICRLRHADLLDAAHITPDADIRGEPVVSNGLSLCKIHHAAFDRNYFGIKRDYQVVVRPDIMDEHDGPMLKSGLQAIDRSKLIVPRKVQDRPDPERLAGRFEVFAKAADL